MNRPCRLFSGILLALFAWLTGGMAHAESGVDMQVGPATVEVAAVTNSAFRLTVSYNGKPQAAHSVYLASNPNPVSWTTANESGWTGVKSAAGELLVDQSSGLWTLRDSQGKTLIPPGPIGQATRNVQTGKPFVILTAGCSSDRTFEVYGCGDGADALLQDHAQPSVGNGHAVVPYYWSRAGYAALGVSSDDNAPPAWSASSDLGRVSWVFAGNSADLYLMPAASLESAARAYAELSGRRPYRRDGRSAICKAVGDGKIVLISTIPCISSSLANCRLTRLSSISSGTPPRPITA